MAFNLTEVLKALLFASPGSLSVKDIQGVFTRFHEESVELPGLQAGADPTDAEVDAEPISSADVPSLVTATQIREAMEEIRAGLEGSNEVFRLQETHQGWRFVTSASVAEWVRLLRKQPKPLKLTQSALETLSIIAYRQPVVRAEIESIRGVSVDSPINRLLERELIQITGRADLPGRPIQYGTTDAFLEFVGIRSLDELPASDVLSAREIDDWLKVSSEAHVVHDSDVGLDTESGDEDADLDLEPENLSSDDQPVEASEEVSAEPPSRVTVKTVGGPDPAEDMESAEATDENETVEANMANRSAT